MDNMFDYFVQEDKLLPLIADALIGHFGYNISDMTPVWSYLNKIGLAPGEDISCDAAVTAWAMAMMGVRDLSNSTVLDRVYDLAARLSNAPEVTGI